MMITDQHIPTHNVTREVRFANTFGGSSVNWLVLKFLLRRKPGESTARSQFILT
jgi:hypothetical protein